jgi:type VI secretion system protein ImpI
MALTLTIENFSELPDGGPLSISVTGGRGIDIGRDTYLDWTLPDPNMFISGKHCEVRYKDGAYWLYDLSLNGTFVNGGDNRLADPYRLRHGDRLGIGHYCVAVTLDEEAGAPQVPTEAPPRVMGSQENIWDFEGDVPAPIDPRDLRPSRPRADTADFLDWAIDPPAPIRDEPLPAAREDFPWPADADWLPPAAEAPIPPPPAPVPQPDRPAWGLDRPDQTPAPIPSEVPEFGAVFPPLPPDPASSSVPPLPPASLARPEAAPREKMAGQDFIARFAAAAGIPAEAIATDDPGEFGELVGGLIGLVVEELWQLLEARRETKRMVRCSDPTMTRADNNNPLKFAPTPQDALRQMFGPPSRAYLSARPALHQSFADLKRHQIDTISAMQGAVRMLIEDFDPREIEASLGAERGISAMLGSRKTKLWDIYCARWRAKVRSHDDGLFGAYMDYFAKCYDRNVAERTSS